MVYAVTVKLKDAKKVLDYLHAKNLLDKEFQFQKTSTEISFPSTKLISTEEIDGISGLRCVQAADDFFKASKLVKSLKEVLATTLSKVQLDHLKSAYDQIGTIAILEIDDQLRSHEVEIATALMQANPTIKTVLRKDGAHEGQYRTQKMKFLAGFDTRETVHIESGVKIKIDVEQVYFSPRLSTERLRIAQLVKPLENVMVFFSGAAPYCLVLAKKTDAQVVVGVEVNPIGHKCGLESVKLNKLKNVYLFCGDVHKLLPTITGATMVTTKPSLPKTYDRIVMNLPKSAHEFLDDALAIAKQGTIIHYYDFLHEDEFDTAIQRVKEACERNSKLCKILGIYTCGAQGVRIYRICVDVEIV